MDVLDRISRAVLTQPRGMLGEEGTNLQGDVNHLSEVVPPRALAKGEEKLPNTPTSWMVVVTSPNNTIHISLGKRKRIGAGLTLERDS